MNITEYNSVLWDGIVEFKNAQHAYSVEFLARKFEVISAAHLFDLTRDGILKEAYTTENIKAAMGRLVLSMGVLYTIIKKDRPLLNDRQVEDFFDSKLETMRKLCVAKNNDYSPFNILKAGNLGLAARIGDKISRIRSSFERSMLVNENIIETTLDMVNYSVFHLMIMKGVWVTDGELREFCQDLYGYGKTTSNSDARYMAQIYDRMNSPEASVYA